MSGWFFFKRAAVFCFGAWLVATAVNVVTGGGLGVEPFSHSMSRIWENFTNLSLILEIARFFLTVAVLVLLWTVLVAWGATGLHLLSDKVSAESAVYWSFGLSTAILIVFNSMFYPLSAFSVPLPGAVVGHVLAALLLLMFLPLVLVACLRKVAIGISALSLAVVVVLALSLGTGGNPLQANAVEADDNRPNVFIIGVDALRPRTMGYFGYQPSPTPNLDALLEYAAVYPNAYTPAARTHTAWFSILTGQYPLTTGARFNLTVPEYVNKEGLITYDLQDAGYSTIWALDERHFNNIGEQEGFDIAVGPKIGAADLPITIFADNPIVNLVANTDIGKVLFPYVSNNRGNFITYNPFLFNDELLGAVSQSREPLFLAAHYTLPHYPFVSNLMPEVPEEMTHGHESSLYRRYLSMINLADRQLGDLIGRLQAAGALDNAVVYLLSDHGEGLGLEGDGLQPGYEGAQFDVNVRGHGTNLLTPVQFRVLMAKLRFKDGKPLSKGYENPALVSLVDVAPDVIHETGVESPTPFDGVPFHEAGFDRSIFIESSFSVDAIKQERVDQVEAMNQAASFYSVNDQGNLFLRPDGYNELLAAKQRGVIRGNTLVAVYPDETESALVADLKEQKWWPSLALEFTEGGPEWKPLLRSLCDFYRSDEHFEHHGFCEFEDN